MRMVNLHMRSTAIAALMSVPLATGAAVAQQQTDQTTQQAQDSAQQQSQEQSSQSATGSGQAAGDQQEDAIVATVGDAEIRGSDVMTVIGMLPPQLQSQPPQMLVPMALEQLILRELILEEARGQNLADDPEVQALVENSAQTAEEDAMVQIWLDREMASVVTDEAVQQVYEGAQAQGAQDLPPVEEVRAQIEQHLRQQAMQDIRMRLREGADVVLYDPTGRPMEQQQGGGGDSSGTATSGQSGSATSGNTASGQSGGGEAGDAQSGDAQSGGGQSGGGQSSGDAAGGQSEEDAAGASESSGG